MSGAPSLDSFGEIYRGFKRDREIVRAWIDDVDEEWLRAFEDLRGTKELYQCSDEVIARETMRVLLSLIPPTKKRRRRFHRRKYNG